MRKSRSGFVYRGTHKKICNFCKIEFEALKLKTRFCSISCWNRSTRPEYKINCPVCGIERIFASAQSYWGSKNKNKKCKSCKQKEIGAKPEYRNKLRKRRIEQLEKKNGQIHPNYNPVACKAIEEYAKQYGYNFKHAENGGEFYIAELGYWVDGYDKEKNIVIEYDELHHQSLKQKNKDLIREQEIIDFLKCKFIRILETKDNTIIIIEKLQIGN